MLRTNDSYPVIPFMVVHPNSALNHGCTCLYVKSFQTLSWSGQSRTDCYFVNSCDNVSL